MRLFKKKLDFDDVGYEILMLMAGWIKVGFNLDEVWNRLLNEVPFLNSPVWLALRSPNVQILPVDKRFQMLFQGQTWGQVRAVLELGYESGNCLGTMLETCAKNHKRKLQLKKKINTLTAEGRLSAWVVGLSPIFLLICMGLLSPDLVMPLFQNSAGRILLGLALFLCLIGICLTYRLTKVDI